MVETVYIPLSRGQVALIDAHDAAIVRQFKWHATPNPMGGYYAMTGVTNAQGRRTSLYMHRLITGATVGGEVDHVNHDTLDNRRQNLSLGTHRDNMRNAEHALTVACPLGHLYDADNTYTDKKGRRSCRTCKAQAVVRWAKNQTPEIRESRRLYAKAYYERTKDEQLARQRRKRAEASAVRLATV